MTLGGSLVLFAIGAILKFAVTASVSGIDLGTVGVVLMAVGAVGFVISSAWLLSQRRRASTVQQRTYAAPVVQPVVEDRAYRAAPPPERRVVEDPYDPRV